MYNDDTSMRILRSIREPAEQRTGTFTSGIVSLVDACTEVLKQGARELPAPIQMCDALSCNTPKGVETLIANCLAHGRRQVVEVVDHFLEECRYVLETLGGVYHNDAVSRERKLSPEDRLHVHQEHSGPLMRGLHEWMEAQLAEHKTEPNSGLGKAISYLLNHCWRSFHKSDPHVRAERSQYMRLADRVAAAHGGVEAKRSVAPLQMRGGAARSHIRPLVGSLACPQQFIQV